MLLCVSLNAQHIETDTLRLRESVVTGIAGPVSLRESPVPFTYISADALAAQASTNIVDALSHFPGVSQISTGAGISKPVIRGLGYNRVVVVNDGVRQEGQQWGDEHGVEVDAFDVYSAEVLKGAASLIYGSDAIGGVVIMHSRPEPIDGETNIIFDSEYHGNNGLLGSSVNAEGRDGSISWAVRASGKTAHAYHNAIDGFVPNSQYNEKAFSGRLGFHKGRTHSHLKFSYWNEKPSIPEMGMDADENTYKAGLPYQDIGHLKLVWDNMLYLGNGTLSAVIAYQNNHRQEFEEATDEAELDMRLGTLNYNFRYTLPDIHGWKLTSGLGGMYQSSANHGEESLIPDHHLFDAGIFETASKSFSNWDLSGGVRLDLRSLNSNAEEGHFEAFKRNFTAISASIGAVWHPVKGLDLRANASRGFRAPNISELASNGEHEGVYRYEIGSSELSPEKSNQFDFGFTYSRNWLSVDASLFANRINDYIYLYGTSEAMEDMPVYAYGQADARLLGGEFVVEIHPIEDLHFGNSVSVVDARFCDKDKGYLPFTPAPRWISELSYVLGDFTLGARLEHNFAQEHFYSEGDTETSTPAYTLLDASVSTDISLKDKKLCTVTLFCDNIANTAYQSHLSRLKYIGLYNPGRNLGVKLKFYIL